MKHDPSFVSLLLEENIFFLLTLQSFNFALIFHLSLFSLSLSLCFQLQQNHHHHHIDEKKTFMDSTTGITAIQKPCPVPELVQQQQQQPPPPLKCPRCDSSNTKFCYYNNYSLSQPRHFCKACKRYWTRGGTLRNVPVGGGCRKNKRVKRPVSAIDAVSSSSTTSTSSAPPSNSNPPSQTQIDYLNPLFYGFPTNPSDMNLPFSSFNTSGFDLHPQLNGLGIGFSSGDYRNGFINNPTKQIQDIFGNSNSLFSSYNSLFTSPSLNTSSATMASVLASKFSNGGLKDGREPNNHFQTLASFEGLHMGNTDVKLEDAQNRLEWNSSHHQTQQMGPSDPSALYWNATSVSSNWHDSSNNNIGSSVPSLI